MKRVLVVGGGISGLSTAYFLSKVPGISVTLIESSGRLGGSIRTEEYDGFLMEGGPDSFLSEKPAATELAIELGLENELIETREHFRKVRVARGACAYEIPKGFYLIAPSDAGAFLKSPILSWQGKVRAMSELFVPARREGDDESVGSFIRRRFGRELLERIGQPMVAGIHTGDPESLSLRATFPKFLDWEEQHGSVIRGLIHQQGAAAARGPRYGLFLSFRRGMETLVRTLADKIPAVSIRMTRIERLEKKTSSVWTAFLADGDSLEADAVCLAAGVRTSSGLLRGTDPALSNLLDGIGTESVAGVQLAFGPNSFSREPDSVGLIVPAIEHRSIVAATFANLKYEGRAPEGHYLVRAYIGGAFGRSHFQQSDDELVRSALADLRELSGLRAEPLFSRVYRHADAMVQYSVGHLDRVDRMEAATAAHSGLYLTGTPYRGVGISDCVAQAKKTANQISEKI